VRGAFTIASLQILVTWIGWRHTPGGAGYQPMCNMQGLVRTTGRNT
jgi:hypothetical protein